MSIPLHSVSPSGDRTLESGDRARRGSLVSVLVGAVVFALALVVAPAAGAAGPVDAGYTGYKNEGGGDFGLLTNSTGDVKAYDAIWDRKVCGIRKFNVYFDWEDGRWPAIPVDNLGSFYEAFNFVYRQSGRKYKVRVTNYGYFGLVRETPGQSNDQVYMRMSVRVKRVARGAKWCGYKKQTFIGFRAY